MAFTGKLGTAASKLGNIQLGRGATIATGGVTQVLSGTSTGTSSTSGALRVSWAFLKTETAVGTTSGSLRVTLRLSGTSSSVSATSGTFQASTPPTIVYPTRVELGERSEKVAVATFTARVAITEHVAGVDVRALDEAVLVTSRQEVVRLDSSGQTLVTIP